MIRYVLDKLEIEIFDCYFQADKMAKYFGKLATTVKDIKHIENFHKSSQFPVLCK